MEIKFPKNFEENAEIALPVGRLSVGPIENPLILRYILSPKGELILVGSEATQQYIKFFKTPEGLFGF
jgi:hypothetical protein